MDTLELILPASEFRHYQTSYIARVKVELEAQS